MAAVVQVSLFQIRRVPEQLARTWYFVVNWLKVKFDLRKVTHITIKFSYSTLQYLESTYLKYCSLIG